MGPATWDRWITALASHYKGRVRDWATWNEPNNCKGNTPELAADNNIRTAQIIKKHIPDARIAGMVLSNPNARFAQRYMKVLSEQGKTGLFAWMIYHDYSVNPDTVFPRVEEFAKVVHQYAPTMRIWQETVRQLLEEPGIAGLKDSSRDMDYFLAIRRITRARPDWSLLVGFEHLLVDAVRAGGDGGVCAGASIQGIKCGLALRGICRDRMAEPFAELSTEARLQVAAILDEFDLARRNANVGLT